MKKVTARGEAKQWRGDTSCFASVLNVAENRAVCSFEEQAFFKRKLKMQKREELASAENSQVTRENGNKSIPHERLIYK